MDPVGSGTKIRCAGESQQVSNQSVSPQVTSLQSITVFMSGGTLPPCALVERRGETDVDLDKANHDRSTENCGMPIIYV
jgi:hypothetical protein